MSTLVVDIDFSAAGHSDRFVLDGWAEAEATHRWTWGRESRVRLPLGAGSADRVLVIDATPCTHPPGLEGQTVMLAVDGRLLASLQFGGRLVSAFRLPSGLCGDIVLSILHLQHAVPRAPAQTRCGQPLGLMLHSLRVYRLEPSVEVPGGSAPALALHDLAARFESLGQGCHFGLIQRQCGIEPLGLLRFVDSVTSMLADGLVTAFSGIGRPGRLEFQQTADAEPRYRWRHKDFGLIYDTRLKVCEWSEDELMRRESRRLGFLQRKFAEELALAEKIFVLTRGDRLTETEALAVLCALRLHGPNILLCAVAGEASLAGEVERLQPGFLRAHLGEVDEHGYAPLDVWRCVMSRALSADECPP